MPNHDFWEYQLLARISGSQMKESETFINQDTCQTTNNSLAISLLLSQEHLILAVFNNLIIELNKQLHFFNLTTILKIPPKGKHSYCILLFFSNIGHAVFCIFRCLQWLVRSNSIIQLFTCKYFFLNNFFMLIFSCIFYNC